MKLSKLQSWFLDLLRGNGRSWEEPSEQVVHGTASAGTHKKDIIDEVQSKLNYVHLEQCNELVPLVISQG